MILLYSHNRKLMKILIFLPLILSCTLAKQTQPDVFERGSKFDLEKVDFSENVKKLFSKHISIDNSSYIEYDSLSEGELTDEKLEYPSKIRDTKPRKFGYMYRTPLLSSVGEYGGLYFEHISILTNIEKKPVAYYAESKMDSIGGQKKLLELLNNNYGKPKYAFSIALNFNICSYEWVLKDRTIQVETGYGLTSDSANSDGIYFNTRILIIENSYKNEIHNSHFFEYNDKVEYYGKIYTPEELGLERKQLKKDLFTLNSTNEEYVNDESHHIKNRNNDPKFN